MTRSSKISLAAGLLVLAVGGLILALFLSHQGPTQAGLWATVLGLPLTVIGTIMTAWSLVVTIRAGSARSLTQDLEVHQDNLADKVRLTETPRLEQLGVTRGQGLNLYYGAHGRIRGAGGEDIGSLQDVWAYYRALRPGRMIVLGDPGVGKTVLAIHLLLDLLEHRDDPADSINPVPVRVNAASWNTDTHFSKWLETQLHTDYGLIPKVCEALVEGGRVLPLLDGLDEMDPLDGAPKRARAALDQLNRAPWRGRPVVVMCRSKVYERIRMLRPGGGPDAGLYAATAVSIRSLTTDEIRAYLDERRDAEGLDPDAWTPVIKALSARSSPFTAALATPWLLTLAVNYLSKGDRSAARKLAACRRTKTLQDLLFAQLIPSAVEARSEEERGRKYTITQTHDWLSALAVNLTEQRAEGLGGTDIALFELWRIAGPPARPHRAMFTVSPALWLALFFTASRTVGLASGLAWGLAGGVFGGYGPVRLFPSPRQLVLRTGRHGALRRRVSAGVWSGVGALFTIGLAVGAAVWFKLGFPFALRAGLAAGITGMFTYGLIMGLAGAEPNRQDEFRVIRHDWIAGLVIGLAAGTTAGFVAWLSFRLTAGMTAGHRFGFGQGPTPGIAIGIGTAIGVGIVLAWTSVRYMRACGRLRKRGLFGGHPAPFLHWARTAGLLRATGGAYQFRHETYLQWLTTHRHAESSE